MDLHDAIELVLREKGAMTAEEIAAEVNRRKLYAKKDGSPVTAHQVGMRIAKRPELFAIDLKRHRP